MPSKQIQVKRSIGRTVTFHAYDGRDYRAMLSAYQNKIATVQYYPINSAGTPIRYICNAYIADLSRITL